MSLEAPRIFKLGTRLRLNHRFIASTTGIPPPCHQMRTLPSSFLAISASKTKILYITAMVESNSPAATKDKEEEEELSDPPLRILSVVGHGNLSLLNSVPWEEVMLQTAKKLKWVDEGYDMQVFTDNFIESNSEKSVNVERELSNADL